MTCNVRVANLFTHGVQLDNELTSPWNWTYKPCVYYSPFIHDGRDYQTP